jgi:hypothetical protein
LERLHEIDDLAVQGQLQPVMLACAFEARGGPCIPGGLSPVLAVREGERVGTMKHIPRTIGINDLDGHGIEAIKVAPKAKNAAALAKGNRNHTTARGPNPEECLLDLDSSLVLRETALGKDHVIGQSDEFVNGKRITRISIQDSGYPYRARRIKQRSRALNPSDIGEDSSRA